MVESVTARRLSRIVSNAGKSLRNTGTAAYRLLIMRSVFVLIERRGEA